ncbi:unnamed protein product [Arctogadus glacialis]
MEQAAFRTDLSVLLEQVGGGKESLSFMKQRMRRLAQQWGSAALRLDSTLQHRWRDQRKCLSDLSPNSPIPADNPTDGNTYGKKARKQ